MTVIGDLWFERYSGTIIEGLNVEIQLRNSLIVLAKAAIGGFVALKGAQITRATPLVTGALAVGLATAQNLAILHRNGYQVAGRNPLTSFEWRGWLYGAMLVWGAHGSLAFGQTAPASFTALNVRNLLASLSAIVSGNSLYHLAWMERILNTRYAASRPHQTGKPISDIWFERYEEGTKLPGVNIQVFLRNNLIRFVKGTIAGLLAFQALRHLGISHFSAATATSTIACVRVLCILHAGCQRKEEGLNPLIRRDLQSLIDGALLVWGTYGALPFLQGAPLSFARSFSSAKTAISGFSAACAGSLAFEVTINPRLRHRPPEIAINDGKDDL